MSEEVSKAIERGLNCRVKGDGGEIECVTEGKVSRFKEMHIFVPCEQESPEVKEIPKNEPAPSQEAKQQ